MHPSRRPKGKAEIGLTLKPGVASLCRGGVLGRKAMRIVKPTGLVLSAVLAAWAAIGIAHGAEEDEEGRYVVVKQILDCSPKILKDGQTLILTLDDTVHGSELAIRRLRGNVWYDLVTRGSADDIKPLMTSEEFALARRVEIPTTITARRQGPNGPIERVFSKPGRYILYSSDNLESEQGGYICTIDYGK